MDGLVKRCIDARKEAFFNAYEINDEDIKNKIDDLFNRINEFGEGCSDSADFETRFASSDLNQEYIKLFTEVATTCKPIVYENKADEIIKTDDERLNEEITSEIKYQLENATMPLRRKARQEVYDKVRDIPGIGDAMEVKQHIDFFSRFKKKKDK